MGSSTYGAVVQLWHLVIYFESTISRLMALFSDSQSMDCAPLVGREGTAGRPQDVYIGFIYLFLNWNS